MPDTYWNSEEYSRELERLQIEYWSSLPKEEPMSVEEFDALEDAAIGRFEKDKADGKCRYVTLSDYLRGAYNDAARRVNPGEYYRVWSGCYPCYYSTWSHSHEHNNKAYYYINKALACGLADNAADAVKWFEDNK